MEARHKTQKKVNNETPGDNGEKDSAFKTLLEDSAREAYSRPWHRIERGLRLNRLRIFVEELVPQHNMTKEEKDALFTFLQKSLDKKLLNTLKIVQYDQEKQRILSIRGLELKRNEDNVLKWGFHTKKKAEGTRKKKKGEEVTAVETKIEAGE
uniref:Uncharacterized protein n=1 Tax=viral metagenome TaxID=1070528 RepID=A0A6C0KMW9_9ZZZZ